MAFTPSTRYCPVRHSPSFAIPQLSPIGFRATLLKVPRENTLFGLRVLKIEICKPRIIFLDFRAKILRIAHTVNYPYLPPWFKEGYCEMKFSKFGDLRAKIWAKTEAVEATISNFFSKGGLVNWLLSSLAWKGTLANSGRGVKGGHRAAHPCRPYPLFRSVPPGINFSMSFDFF